MGKVTTTLICKKVGFSKNFLVKDLSKDQTIRLIKTIEFLNLTISSDLLKFRSLVTKKLVAVKSYRGLRRYQGLPVRGQRTHTNGKTANKRLR